jgi:type II secretory pathway pseudopilin PulG
LAGVVKAVRFPDAEVVVVAAAAASAGLKFNAWVRRACREQAALELALAKQDAETRNGIERPGWDTPLSNGARAAVNREMLKTVSPKVSFRPDFKGGK